MKIEKIMQPKNVNSGHLRFKDFYLSVLSIIGTSLSKDVF